MDRRVETAGWRRVALAIMAALSLSILMPSTALAKETFRMRIQAAVPSGAMSFEMLEAFARRVDVMSEGRLKVQVFGAGAIVPSPQILDSVHRGILEGGLRLAPVLERQASRYVPV